LGGFILRIEGKHGRILLQDAPVFSLVEEDRYSKTW